MTAMIPPPRPADRFRERLRTRARGAARLLPLSTRLIISLALLLAPLGITAALVAVAGLRDLDNGRRAVVASRLDSHVRAFDASLGRDFAMLETVMLTGQAIDGCAVLADVGAFDQRLAATQRFSAVDAPLCGGALKALPANIGATLHRLGSQGRGRFVRSASASDGALWLMLRDNAANGGAVVARLPLAMVAPMFVGRIGPHDRLTLSQGSDRLLAWGAPSACGADARRCPTVRQLSQNGFVLSLTSPVGSAGAVQTLGILLPVLMWVAALVIGWVAAHQLVVTPLLRLRDVVVRYGAGDNSARADPGRFPSREVSELAAAFDALADELGQSGDELRDALEEQRRLTREVHHRVKNNLQIVSSLLSIQARDATSIEASRAYAIVQVRVGALALVHRWMYEDEAIRGVDARALTTDLCAGLEQSLAANWRTSVSILCDVERLVVSQDTAVPLAFLIAELLSFAAAASAPGPLAARVHGRMAGGKLALAIEAPALAGDPVARQADAASRIVQGMARQLRGVLRPGPDGYSIDIALH